MTTKLKVLHVVPTLKKDGAEVQLSEIFKHFNNVNVELFTFDKYENRDSVIDNLNRDLFKTELHRLGVNTIIYYPIPIHLQPAYKTLGYKEGSLPITEKVCSQVISLPIFPELKSIEQSYVIDKIKEIFKK